MLLPFQENMKELKTTIVEPMLFGYMFCIFLSSPIEQQLVYRKVCLQRFENATFCDIINLPSKSNETDFDQNFVQKEAAHWGIYLDVARSAPAFLVTIFYGSLLDRFGRRKIMLFPIIGDLVNIIFQLINSYYMKLHIGYLLFGVMFSACFGSLACFLSAVFSYVADISDKKGRTKRVVLLESMVYLGGIASNLSGGLLLDKFGFIAAYGLIVAVFIAQIIYWFFLLESYHPIVGGDDKKTKNFIKSFFDLKRVKESWHVIRNSNKRLEMYLYFSCFSLSVSLFVAVNSISVLYLMHHPLDFSPAQIGYFFAEFNAVKFLGVLIINYILIRTFRWEDFSVIFMSGIFYAAYSLSISATKSETEVYLAVLCTCGLGAATPSARAGLSKLVLPTEQGRLFSMIAVIEVLVVLTASPLAKYIYEVSVDVSPSFIYYIMASCSLFIFLFASILKFISWKERYHELQETDVIINS